LSSLSSNNDQCRELTTRSQLEAMSAFINSLPHAACCANWLCGYKKKRKKPLKNLKKRVQAVGEAPKFIDFPLKSSAGQNG